MADPLAYFFTWTTYGTWLHGDERGSVNDERSRYGDALIKPNLPWRNREALALKQPSLYLGEAERAIVHDAIMEHCRIRRWGVLALNVRTNHVHAVVNCYPTPPGRAYGQLKANATRRLRETGRVPADRIVWTEDGSKRFLWDEESLANAVRYVLADQGLDLNHGLPRTSVEARRQSAKMALNGNGSMGAARVKGKANPPASAGGSIREVGSAVIPLPAQAAPSEGSVRS